MSRLTLTLLLLAALVLPVAAAPRPDILYTTRKEFLKVGPARPLTLNAHIGKFAYDPLGLEVAVNSQETSGEQTTYFVKTLDVHTGRELHRFSLTAPTAQQNAGLSLVGWTPSGKYLLLERTQPTDDLSDVVVDFVRWDLSADPPKVRVTAPEISLPEGIQSADRYGFTSPHNQRVLFDDSYTLHGQHHSLYEIYDAEQDTFHSLVTPPNAEVFVIWQDDSHLFIRVKPKEARLRIDVVTGQISPIPGEAADTTAVSQQYPDLALDTEARPQPDDLGSGQFPSQIVWVRCKPRQRRPLSTVGAAITMGDDDPQAVWSPSGKQLAYLNHGDLYVSEVAPVPPEEGLAYEKSALGLPMTCPEERTIAASNLRQIGLAITQYMQDFDENFPAAGGIDETLYPYIKNRSVFNIGTVHWLYHAPENLSYAAMESPAITVIGTMDLPCGRLALMADGHVHVEVVKEQEAP